MILPALYELYERLNRDPEYEICPPGFSLQKIVFRVVLQSDGRLHAITDARIKDQRGNLHPRQLKVLGHPKSPGSGFNPCTLWDTAQYMLGYKPEDKNPQRTRKSFVAFRKHHLGLEGEINCPAFSAVCRFLEYWDPSQAENWPVLEEVGPGYGVFQIVEQTKYVHDEDAIESWWRNQLGSKNEANEGQCLVTGQYGPVTRLQYKIKKVGKQGESLLVSFNDSAYESYGNKQSFNAPISENAAFRYATALNSLTDGPKSHKHRFSVGDATVVFWTKEPTNTEDIFAQFATGAYAATENATEAQDEGVRQKIELFLKALRKGREAYAELDGQADQTPFYLLGMTGQAKGRIGVRFFYTDCLSTLLDNLRRHYDDLRMVRRFEEGSKHPDPEFPALRQILDETCPRDRKNKPMRDQIPPILEGPLLRAVIAGTPYPAGLFTAVMRRVHADREVNHVRACIIAGYFRRNLKQEVSMCLDTERNDPAYRLGRLFAVLERIQELAHWYQTGNNLEKGIRDSYFSAACLTPASVFPRIERLSTHHRRHLLGSKKHYYDQLIADIREGQKDPPNVLALKEQAAFLLGYYHQWKQLRQKKDKEAAEQETEGE